jgi:hypothetical protein
MAAPRLTEQVVHAVCAELAQQGEDPTTLKLHAKLGRGSLTTITKYLKSWGSTEDQKAGMMPKDIDLWEHVVELGKLRVLYEISLAELSTIRAELQTSNQALLEAEKRVANLEGQLEAYRSLKPSEGDVKQTIRKGPVIYRPKNKI